MNDSIAQACEVLARWKYCRSQGAQVQKCIATHGRVDGACEQAVSAFKTCAQAQVQPILQDLVKIADTKCPNDVAAHTSCVAQYGEAKCEHLDRAALECAAREVLASLRRPAAQ